MTLFENFHPKDIREASPDHRGSSGSQRSRSRHQSGVDGVTNSLALGRNRGNRAGRFESSGPLDYFRVQLIRCVGRGTGAGSGRWGTSRFGGVAAGGTRPWATYVEPGPRAGTVNGAGERPLPRWRRRRWIRVGTLALHAECPAARSCALAQRCIKRSDLRPCHDDRTVFADFRPYRLAGPGIQGRE